jgi:glycosyltransferase involved in cell wall biosynthesis
MPINGVGRRLSAMVCAVKQRRILVFAHVPPPHHGQSVMVQVLLDGLRADARFEVHHVDARISDDLQDIGSFRPKKFIRLFKCILQAWWIRLRYGRMAFYYVPAPAKQSAILRDWVVMTLCRPLFPELILHWHAYGLGEWVESANNWQGKLTRRALGNADLSIVLNNYNRRDAEVFAPKRIAVVPNGIADLFPDYETGLAARRETRATVLKALELRAKVGRCESGKVEKLESVRFLFLGHLIESKGVFVAIEAATMVNLELRKSNAPWRAHLTLAGSFASEDEKVRIVAAMDRKNVDAGEEGRQFELAGFLDSGQKKSALEEADCLVFPTFYDGETQGLFLLEAMSAGLPCITTSWRGVPEVLPDVYPGVVRAKAPNALAAAMLAFPTWSDGLTLRRKFTDDFTARTHLDKLKAVLL